MDVWELHGRSKPAELTDDLLEARRPRRRRARPASWVSAPTRGSPELIPAIIRKLPHFDMVQTSYNFTMDPAIEALIESAAQAGVGVVAMKVMAGGFNSVKPGQKGYDALRREGVMLAALKWALKNPNVTNADPEHHRHGAARREHAGDVGALLRCGSDRSWPLSSRYIRPLYCRMCGSCAGKCPQGMPVADVLRWLSYAEGYGEFQLGRESFLSLPAEVRDVRCDVRDLRHPVSQRSEGGTTIEDRPGAVCMKPARLRVPDRVDPSPGLHLPPVLPAALTRASAEPGTARRKAQDRHEAVSERIADARDWRGGWYGRWLRRAGGRIDERRIRFFPRQLRAWAPAGETLSFRHEACSFGWQCVGVSF